VLPSSMVQYVHSVITGQITKHSASLACRQLEG